MAKITCVFRRTTEGRLALLFARDLLKLWPDQSESGARLHVHLEPNKAEAKRICSSSRPVEDLLADERRLVLQEVQNITGLEAEAIAISTADCQPGGILVDHVFALQRADLDVLYPSREKTLLGRGRGPILVPFGDSLSALPAVQIALSMAVAMALPVVLYHTTWKDDGISSKDPADHMCADARRVAESLMATAAAAGVKHSLVVETADDVAEGILQCALRLSACLVVMPRSAKTTMGCYVNQALAKTPLPLLAVAARPLPRQAEGGR